MNDKHHDRNTNVVFISDTLKTNYKYTFNRLTKLMDEMDITWRIIRQTNDIWARDYMPIQLEDKDFLLYKYYPDYLNNNKFRKYITDAHKACNELGINYTETDILLDGGNVTPCGDKFVITSKVLMQSENKEHLLSQLSKELKSEIIVIPWHKIENSDDVYGHSDGFIHWCGGNKVLMSNHRETDAKEASEIRKIIESNGFEVTEMLFDKIPDSNQNFDLNWAYVNYLQVGNKIIMPSLGIAEDKYALKYVKDANPDCIVRQFRMRDIVRLGGGLHCITWNIRIPDTLLSAE